VADYAENTSVLQRVATLTVSVGGLPAVTVTVTQEGVAPILQVTPSNRNVAPGAGSTDFTVTSNTGWTAVADSAWCVVTPAGSGNGSIIADYALNPYYFSRVATITVTVAGIPAQQVTLTQAQSTVSVADPQSGEIRLYPNPTAGKFRIISRGNPPGSLEVRVMDLTGKLISIQRGTIPDDCVFDLTTLPEGCYFVKIRTSSAFLIHKLVIIR